MVVAKKPQIQYHEVLGPIDNEKAGWASFGKGDLTVCSFLISNSKFTFPG
jgi:hypothetical protein